MKLTLSMLCLLAACGSSRKHSDSTLKKIPWGMKMQSPTVVFAYDQWSSEHPNVKERAKKYESAWKEEVRRAFVGATQLMGIGGDDVAVTITIVDMDPGSQAARAWVGWGAGKGFIKAKVVVTGYGDFLYEDEIKGGGWTGGRFEEVLRDLGTGVAGVIARNRERP